ncbi:hypothetical protein ACTZGB_16790 [Yersinia bercovieri]|uniref:hypothetical protein n=1 Tax=Yersinia bercovieri TaxID=634 RepID=UPI0011A83F5A|nr:hypothetical protein [Yersinia bercovieri]
MKWILHFIVMVMFASSTVVYSAPVTKEIKVEATIPSILELDILNATRFGITPIGDIALNYNPYFRVFHRAEMYLRIRHNSDIKQGYNLSINDNFELTMVGRSADKNLPVEIYVDETLLSDANPIKVRYQDQGKARRVPGGVIPIYLPLRILAVIPDHLHTETGELYTGTLTFTLEPLS